MNKKDLETYYFEHKHQRRYIGIFLMFAVIAIVIGILAAFSVANMTGYGFFDNIFGTKTTMTNSPESPAIVQLNGNVTYQGVLDMLNKIRFVIQSPYVPNRRTCDVLCREIYNNTCILAQRMWEVNNSNQSINIIVGCGDTEIDRFAYNCVCAKPLY